MTQPCGGGESGDLSDGTISWLKKRGISQELLKGGGQSGTNYIRGLGKEVSCVFFRTEQGPDIRAEDTRHEEKVACNGAACSFFNVDGLYGDDLFICEGEMDALTLIECGFERGVRAKRRGDEGRGRQDRSDEDAKFKFLWDARRRSIAQAV